MTSAVIARSMAAQLKRVNDDETPEQTIKRLRAEVAYWQKQVDRKEEARQYWQTIAENADSGDSREWLLTSDYCKAHNVTMSYLNRALNQKDGYHLSIPGKRSSTGRWMVHVNAVFSHSKKPRQKAQGQ